MSRILSCLLGLILMGIISPAQAHFIAYEKLYNPATGQILEEYYDNHHTTNPAIDPRAQQQEFIHQAKQRKNVLIITEDSDSHNNQNALHFDPKINNKAFIEKCIQDYPPASPLLWSYAQCFIHDLPAFNMECRPDNNDEKLASHYIQEIDAYNDSIVLNKFYRSLPKLAQEYTLLENGGSLGENFNYQFFAVDARALHAIANNPDKHIMIVAGTSHLLSINNILLQLGWIPLSMVVAEGFTAPEKEAFLNVAYKIQPTPDHAHVCFEFDVYLATHSETVRSHALDISSLEVDTRCSQAPQPQASLVNNHFSELITALTIFEHSLWSL